MLLMTILASILNIQGYGRLLVGWRWMRHTFTNQQSNISFIRKTNIKLEYLLIILHEYNITHPFIGVVIRHFVEKNAAH